MLIVFDTLNVYYLPQYVPIIEQLKKRNHQVKLVCYSNKNDQQAFSNTIENLHVECIWVKDKHEAKQTYLSLKPEWIFFGNESDFLDEVHQHSKTAQLGHGVGPKPSYYHKSKTPMTVRFIEGALRLSKIKEYYPKDKFVQVGFSKLDPMFNQTEPGFDLAKLGLDPNKKTILYAPTFNPSSLECFPDNWPTDFKEYNILIKPHSLTQVREQYKKQRDKLAKWSKYSNVYVAKEQDISLLPFMKNADILLSEASSTLFEFAALNKPVIVCNFFKLKWSYRGIFKFRFNNRFGKDNVLYSEIGFHVNDYASLLDAIPQQLSQPEEFKENRLKYTSDHLGPTDGLASSRIVDYLELNA
ncbi:CDP-glycerol glycerophosphotransferase family protein [Shewanella sp. 1_MG-2023]|uniref:CDP-glycerol glycerophosphotransferase family protein n=1 Tax=unclassified Shewanella TaxID=196818 RepID=UPI0026E1E70A|nr:MULTISPECIES: CDP-glycerol glycerophosphotransferase family protein [unclassified Shewanella]MDO6611973.1 CDP-glycerol glycerophosphotransferase family protein [Shewanella sp. 7_MG-2023]MDO6771951.1 CDP-glycerol glycerophosphotransferase family protein [Shewanella sp. 2_MG-2023]MDO6794295.1 CDP-glycerol glycerophosphotransferase family protein [Shewanella sp. 1_MG-2023]